MDAMTELRRRLVLQRADLCALANRQSADSQNQLAIETANRACGIGEAIRILDEEAGYERARRLNERQDEMHDGYADRANESRIERERAMAEAES